MKKSTEHKATVITHIAKIYPEYIKLVVYHNPYIKISGLTHFPRKMDTHSDALTLSSSINRTRTAINDIVICNEFNQWATFTFCGTQSAAEKYGYVISDRSNPEELKNKMMNWLKNQKKINGKFEYLIVAEYHKKHNAIHFHALMKNYKGKLVEARDEKTNRKLKQNGRQLYHVKSYRLGHSTLVNINPEDIQKVGNYCRKYITKDMPQFKDSKRYWCSKGLKRPYTEVNSTHANNPHLSYREEYEDANYTILKANVRIDQPTVID